MIEFCLRFGLYERNTGDICSGIFILKKVDLRSAFVFDPRVAQQNINQMAIT